MSAKYQHSVIDEIEIGDLSVTVKVRNKDSDFRHNAVLQNAGLNQIDLLVRGANTRILLDDGTMMLCALDVKVEGKRSDDGYQNAYVSPKLTSDQIKYLRSDAAVEEIFAKELAKALQRKVQLDRSQFP